VWMDDREEQRVANDSYDRQCAARDARGPMKPETKPTICMTYHQPVDAHELEDRTWYFTEAGTKKPHKCVTGE